MFQFSVGKIEKRTPTPTPPRPTLNRTETMADEVLALHTQLCGHIKADLNEILVSRLRSLTPDEGRTLRERCLASQTAESITLLGLWYLYTPGDEQYPARAVECFRKSADRGDPVAMHHLGIALRTGHGVPQDEGLAVE